MTLCDSTTTATDVITIVRSLTIDDIVPFWDSIENVAPGVTTFKPGFHNLITTYPGTMIGHTYSLIWSARSGSPKAILLVSLRDQPEKRSAKGDIGITVHPQYRRRGIASRMLDRLIAASPAGNATQILRSQLCMKDGADFLTAYLTKRGIPFVDRFQTNDEFIERFSTPSIRAGKHYATMRQHISEWLESTPQPHTGVQMLAMFSKANASIHANCSESHCAHQHRTLT